MPPEPLPVTLTTPAATVRTGSPDTTIVRLIQQRLNAVGCGPIDADGDFGPETARAVRLFQARFTDLDRLPLKVDGEVGPLTWQALMRGATAPASAPSIVVADPLMAEVLAAAARQIGVMEDPPGSNRGREVDAFLRAAGLDPATGCYPWCAAFVYWCFAEAARSLGRPNPAPRTAGVMEHWRKAGLRGVRRIAAVEASETPSLVRGGLVFFISTGEGTGHTGFVERLAGGKLVTIEGNTNDGGGREGVGVFRRDKRKIGEINVGFLDYGDPA
jgi:peptidoglycan hydrolase-like protein with peptidoglycan-binding domain